MSRCRLCNTTSIRPFRSLPNQPAQFLNNLETFGAEGGIISEGVAQVIDGLGNPLVITGDSHIQLLISTRLFWSLIQSV